MFVVCHDEPSQSEATTSTPALIWFMASIEVLCSTSLRLRSSVRYCSKATAPCWPRSATSKAKAAPVAALLMSTSLPSASERIIRRSSL